MSFFDLRVYHVIEVRLPVLERVLREAALPILGDHGMTPIGFWAGEDGETLYQITRHASDTIEDDWARLHADPRWQRKLRDIRQDRSAVRHVETILLTGLRDLPPFRVQRDAR